MDTSLPEQDTKATGFVLGTCLHVVGLPLVALVPLEIFSLGDWNGYSSRLLVVACNFGWTQLPYMVPAAIALHVRGQRSARNGLLIAVGIGFLLTSGCWGFIAIAQ